jgi:hypothetical protein
MRCTLLTATLLITSITPAPAHCQVPAGDRLPDTAPLTLEEPLDVVMVRGISRFAERELAATIDSPVAIGTNLDDSHDAANKDTWRTHWRSRLRHLTGAVDERVPPLLTVVSAPADVVADTGRESRPSAQAVRWDVLEGVTAEGLLLLPAGEVTGYAVAVPDASWTPEMFCGLAEGVPAESQLPRRLVERGVVVLVPMLISRDDEFSGHPDIRYTNIPHREFVYRMAFELGRHIIGYEVQKVLAGVDVLQEMAGGEQANVAVGLCGVGDGGQLAMYAAAIGEPRGPTLTCGYFSQRHKVWQEPIDRNIWKQLQGLSDAHVACLAATNGLMIVEASAAPPFAGPKPARDGRPDFAAPGTVATPPIESVRAEFARTRPFADPDALVLFESAGGTGPAGGSEAFDRFLAALRDDSVGAASGGDHSLTPPAAGIDQQQRQRRQLYELVRFTQMLLHRSDKVRDMVWKDADRSSPQAWQKSTLPLRARIHEEMIGVLDVPDGVPPAPRTRKVIDEPTHVGYEVTLDVIPGADEGDAGVIAGGILLLPRDLKEGERRPVVVCQHGLEGTPMDTITIDESTRAFGAYKGFATQLVQRGFIVYAPQNPYRGEHDFRVIQRKSNPLGRSLFSYIIEQHRVTLKWLASLPWVDAERIGFYGLSYGGKTAVRVPPLVPPGEGDNPRPGYCLSICSADFNEWIRKNVSSEDRYSYVFTKEYEMFEWNMGHLAGYGDLASLMIPRPFMVERGHDDGVAPDEWVAWEYAKVRRRYNKLGIGERTEIEFFDGPHTINGVKTFEFLHRHLHWPAAAQAVR